MERSLALIGSLALVLGTASRALAQAAPPPAEPAAAPPVAPAEKDAAIDVVIPGTRVQETSGSAHVVRPKQLERFKYTDPHSVLVAVPGVYVRGEDGFGLRPNIGMRGAISDRSKKITLMEDGVLFGPAPYSAPAAYYFPLIARMYSVRVLKGPSAIIHGPHTVAGAIDLVTAPLDEGRHAMADLAFGQYMSRKAHLRASVGDEKLAVLVEGIHIGNSGFKKLDGGGDTGFSRNELMAKGRYTFPVKGGVGQELELKVGYSNELSNETYLGLTDADFAKTPLRRYGASRLDLMEWNRTQVALTHRMRRGNDVEVLTTFYRHDFHRIWRKVNGLQGASIADVLARPTTPRNAIFHGVLSGQLAPSTSDENLLVGPNDRNFVSQGVQTTLKWSPQTGPIKHRFELGTRLHYDSVKRVHTQDSFVIQPKKLVPTGDPTDTTVDNTASTTALSVYALDAATWGPVTLTAGARLESIHGELEDRLAERTEGMLQQVVLPGAGVFVALPKDFGVLFGVHKGFSPIPPGQSTVVRPETSVNYEWGARWSPRRFRAEVIGFYNDYSNLSNVCTASTGCVDSQLDQQSDGGRVRVYGVEAYVESEVRVTRKLTLPGRLAYTFTRATFLTDFSSVDPIFGDVKAGDDVPYIPRHQLTASVGAETAWISGNLAGTYVSRMREIAGQGQPASGEATDAYFLLDAALSVKPIDKLTLYVLGRNLLNSTYIVSRRPFGARPGAPIWFQGGVKLEL